MSLYCSSVSKRRVGGASEDEQARKQCGLPLRRQWRCQKSSDYALQSVSCCIRTSQLKLTVGHVGRVLLVRYCYCKNLSLYKSGEWICSSKLLGCQLRVVVTFEAEGKLRSSYQKVLRRQSPSAICLAAAATTYHGSGNGCRRRIFRTACKKVPKPTRHSNRKHMHMHIYSTLQRRRVMRGNAGHALLGCPSRRPVHTITISCENNNFYLLPFLSLRPLKR